MRNRPHNLSLDQIDRVIDQVRVETMQMLERRSASARAARAAPVRSPLLVKGTLNGDEEKPLDLTEFLPLPMGFYKGGAQCEAMSWVPDVLYLDGARWRITEKWFSCGRMEVSAHLGKSLPKKQAKLSEPSISESTESEEATEQRFLQSVRRSRKMLREKLYEAMADHLITLGKRGKFDSLDAFWSVWDRFNRAMRDWAQRNGREWKAVCVPELHADGETWHAHVGVNGFWPFTVLWFQWQKALGGRGSERGNKTLGSCRIDRIKVRGAKRLSRAAIAGRVASYLGKYLGKGFSGRNRGRRLFAASRGLHPHRVVRWVCDHRAGIPQLAFALLGRLGSVGAGTRAVVKRWDRATPEGNLLRCGFFFSTEWSGVT